MTTIRILLSLTASKNWYLHQLDVNTTFLQGDLEEYMYIKVPSGLKVFDKNMVCKIS